MQPEIVTQCPACGGQTFHPYLTVKDHSISQETFHVEQCKTCQLLITNPRPAKENVNVYYQSPAYISHHDQPKTLFDRIYLTIRQFAIKHKLNLISKKQPKGNLLDFGCGTGEFLRACATHGYHAEGIEPSTEAREAAIRKELTVLRTLDETKSTFNIITLWHVLEHVYTPVQILRELKERLTQDGTIFIAVPNWESYDARHYQAHWAALDVPRHVWHFSRNSMEKLLANNGLKIQQVLPMKFDSYYVSLLSEKYIRNGKLSPIAILVAIYQGFYSNLKARSTREYSSLIYVVTHA